MSSTVFVNGVTLSDEDWFNDLNRLHYTIFSDPADIAAVRTALLMAYGTYTPTLTNTTNVAASTANPFQYSRVGSTVTVSGAISVDPTAAAPTSTQLGISIPIASNFADSTNAAGSAHSSATEDEHFVIYADATNDRVTLEGMAKATANHTVWVQFTYRVI